LRSYEIDPVVFGGDPECEHEWGSTTYQRRSNDGGNETRKQITNVGANKRDDPVTYAFCSKCNAWRGQLGLEKSIDLFLDHMMLVMEEVWRILRNDGICFVNISDTMKNKSLCLIPQKFAIRCQEAGWIVRSVIHWCKGTPMPESVKDRPVKATEDILMLTKKQKYYYDSIAVRGMSNTANKMNSLSHVTFERGVNPHSVNMSSQRSNISPSSQWSPYLILSALFCAEGIFIKQREDFLSDIFNLFKLPGITRTIFCAYRRAIIDIAPKILLDIFQYIDVIISQTYLDSHARVWEKLIVDFSVPKVKNETSFSVKEASKIIAKLIANFQIIRDAFPPDFLFKSFIDINMIKASIPLGDSFWLSSQKSSNFKIIKSLIKEINFLVCHDTTHDFSSFVCHKKHSQQDGLNNVNIIRHGPSCQGHNLRNYWFINAEPQKAIHFATWPSKLVETMVRAGSSPRTCEICGAPWVRVVDYKANYEKRERAHQPGNTPTKVDSTGWKPPTIKNLGWKPTCKCENRGAGKCVVADIFCGIGTTVLVAEKLGRIGVGLDLSSEYLLDIAKGKIDAPMQKELF
jgi:hypothetical protein